MIYHIAKVTIHRIKKILSSSVFSIDNTYDNADLGMNAASAKLDLNLVQTNMLATLYLKLQAKYFLSESALQSLINGMLDVSAVTNANIFNILKENNVNILDNLIVDCNVFKTIHNTDNGKLREKNIIWIILILLVHFVYIWKLIGY